MSSNSFETFYLGTFRVLTTSTYAAMLGLDSRFMASLKAMRLECAAPAPQTCIPLGHRRKNHGQVQHACVYPPIEVARRQLPRTLVNRLDASEISLQ